MHGNLIVLAALLLIASFAGATAKKPIPGHCNNLIQMGLMSNLISTGKLAENLPNMSKESLDFLKSDFDRVRKATEKAVASGKAPPENLLEQLMQRTQLTEPTKGKHFNVQGESDLIANGSKARRRGGIEEEKVAYHLSDMGYQVKFNDGKTINTGRLQKEGLNPKKNPDLEINGKIFDIYTPQSSSHSTAEGVIRKVQSGQTHRVVIDLTGPNPERLTNKLRDELHQKNPDGLHEVLVIRYHEDIPELVRVFP